MRKLILLASALLPMALSGQTNNSWDGKGLVPNSKISVLNMFVNIIYDVTDNDPCANQDNAHWPSAYNEGINNEAIPDFLLDFMDTVYIAGNTHGAFTRLYGESSFDSLQITGDFIVVNILESRILQGFNAFNTHAIFGTIIEYINDSGGLRTVYHHDKISDYTLANSKELLFTNLLIRNIKKNYGGHSVGEGTASMPNNSLYKIIIENDEFYLFKGTTQCVGSGDAPATNPTNIVTHELSHKLFGGNEFHTSGGNHRRGHKERSPFLTIQGGYGLMGAANSSLVSCNGYERWRMHWKHPDACDYISARDIHNTQSVASDICKADGNQALLLRDFVTYGDAIRIKLPYKDSTTSTNQYIWLENHQMMNDKLDFLQYSNTHNCRPQDAAGVYAYYQIGRDVLSSIEEEEIWDSCNKDNLRIIPAEGFWDYSKHDDNYSLQCVDWTAHDFHVRRDTENPFCGSSDLEKFLFPAANHDTITVSMEKEMRRKVYYNTLGDTVHDNSLAFFGDLRDAFTEYTRLNMATNPSTCNAKTFYNRMNDTNFSTMQSYNSELNTQTTYLTGLSIVMVPNLKDYIVLVRWDDYDITNSANWTGRIALKEQANLKTGNTITLRQNRTVGKNTRDTETGYFAGRTMLVCEGGSLFTQDTATVVSITENSIIRLDSASSYVVGNNSVLRVENGELVARKGSSLTVNGSGRIEIGPQGTATISNTALLGGQSKIIVENGGKLVIDKAVLTSNVMWQGIEMCDGATVEMRNGARIEYSHNAIRTMVGDDWDHAGGTIKIQNSTFHNCHRSIEFLAYNPNSDSYIINTTFEVNDTLYSLLNNNAFFAQISAYHSFVPTLEGCTFVNASGNSLGYAVNIIDSQVSVTNYNPNGYGSNDVNTYFNHFAKAFNVNNTGNYTFSVQHSSFTGNKYGIFSNGVYGANISDCMFELMGNETPPYPEDRYGIHMTGCPVFSVSDNTITNSSSDVNGTGIYIDNSGSNTNYISGNVIQDMNQGIHVSGNNMIAHYINGWNGIQIPVYLANVRDGLQIKCNTMSGCTHGIELATGASVGTNQGLSSASAGNAFTGNTYDIYNSGTSFHYFYNGSAPSVYGSVTLTSTTADGCYNGPIDLSQQPNLAGAMDNAQPQETDWNTVLRGVYSRISPADSKLDSLQMCYEAINSIHAKYALVEILESKGEFANAQDVLYGIPDMFVMNAYDSAEYGTYVRYNGLQKTMRENGRHWHSMCDSDVAELIGIAESGTGRGRERAKAILCFFADLCFEDGTVENTVTDGYAASGDSIIDETTFLVNVSYCTMSGDTLILQPYLWAAATDFWIPTGRYNFYIVHNIYDPYYGYPKITAADVAAHGIEVSFESDVALMEWDSVNNPHKIVIRNILSDSTAGVGSEGKAVLRVSWLKSDGERYTKVIEMRYDFRCNPYDYCDDVDALYGYQSADAGTVVLMWDPFTPNATSWEVEYGDEGFEIGTGVRETVNEPTYTLADLTPPYAIDIYVRTVCGGYYGDWSDKRTFSSGLSVEENIAQNIVASPNPTEGLFTVDAEDITAVEVFDQLGQKVLTDHSGSRTVNAASLPAGVYLLKVKTATGTKYGKLMRR